MSGVGVQVDEDRISTSRAVEGYLPAGGLEGAAAGLHRRFELACKHEVVTDQQDAAHRDHAVIIGGQMNGSATAPATPQLLWTSDAIAAIRELQERENRPDAAFRVDVRLGGCQGFKVYFELDSVQPDDVVFEAAEGVRIVVQEDGLPMISGGIVDYEDSHRGQGFRMANPHAEKACGCGQAFYANFEEQLDAELDARTITS